MVVVDGQGIPLGNYLESASLSEVTLIEPTLERVGVPRPGRGRPRKNPQRLIYDKAADSDPLRARLARRGIELICPHRKNRKKTTHPGWPSIASLQEAMDGRTHLLLVGQFSSTGRTLGISYRDVSGLCQCGLSVDRPRTVMILLLVNYRF